MAYQQNGYTLVSEARSYDEWRGYLLSHGVNVDWSYGNQCWDSCALLWHQYGRRLETGLLGYAYECWTISRFVNSGGPFTQVIGIENVKRGDCVVFDKYGSYVTGHIAFADEDYNGSGYLKCLGQNQGQGIGWGTPSNVVSLGVFNFLGGFRNSNWQKEPEPEPPAPAKASKKFPWVLYARKLRH